MRKEIPGVGVLSYHAGTPSCTSCLHNPIHGGIWLRNGHSQEVGTLGCIVNDNASGQAYMISNQHVFMPGILVAPYTKPMIGDLVLQPPFGTEQRVVGHVAKNRGPANTRYAKNTPAGTIEADVTNHRVEDFYDAALANISTKYSYEIPGIGIPTGHAEPRIGMKIASLTGRTGFLKGEILKSTANTIGSLTDGSIQVSLNIFYSSQQWNPGDSGSVIIDTQTRKALGLIYATQLSLEGGPPIHLACKATTIAKAYNVNFVGKQGTFNPDGSLSTTPSPTPQVPFPDFGISPEILLGGVVVGAGVIGLILFTH